LPQNAEPMFGNIYMTIKGLYVPTFIWENFNIFFYSVIAAIISIIIIRIHAKKVQETQGKQIPVFIISIGLIIILPLLSFLIGGVSATLETPKLIQLAQTSFKFEGGISLPPELIALTLALSLYTATFIAECVRAGIQGVGKGQKEAAASIGLTPNQVLKLVIMPQALRIIIPPTTNQYLNLTKNSSLAAAIAYPDLVLVFAGTALMQTGKAIEIVFITMFTYLTLSITISLFMNWYNKKIAIQEK
jgi:general L-amino acid transport system permease protein